MENTHESCLGVGDLVTSIFSLLSFCMLVSFSSTCYNKNIQMNSRVVFNLKAITLMQNILPDFIPHLTFNPPPLPIYIFTFIISSFLFQLIDIALTLNVSFFPFFAHTSSSPHKKIFNPLNQYLKNDVFTACFLYIHNLKG